MTNTATASVTGILVEPGLDQDPRFIELTANDLTEVRSLLGCERVNYVRVLIPGVAQEVAGLVAEQEQDVADLAAEALAGDKVIRVPRESDSLRDGMPATWWMAAAVRARRQHPELRIDWARPATSLD